MDQDRRLGLDYYPPDFRFGLREYLSRRAARYASIRPAKFWSSGFGFRMDSTVFGRAFGTKVMGQPS